VRSPTIAFTPSYATNPYIFISPFVCSTFLARFCFLFLVAHQPSGFTPFAWCTPAWFGAFSVTPFRWFFFISLSFCSPYARAPFSGSRAFFFYFPCFAVLFRRTFGAVGSTLFRTYSACRDASPLHLSSDLLFDIRYPLGICDSCIVCGPAYVLGYFTFARAQ